MVWPVKRFLIGPAILVWFIYQAFPNWYTYTLLGLLFLIDTQTFYTHPNHSEYTLFVLSSIVIMVLFATFGAFLFLFLVTRFYGNHLYRTAALIAFSGHVFVTLIVVPRVPYGWDIGDFHQAAVEIASGTFTGGSPTVSSFGGLQGLLYTVFTSQPAIIGVFNGLFAVLVYIPIADLASRLYPNQQKGSIGLMLIILFAPLQFLFLSVPMRDALTVLLFFTILAIGIRAIQSMQPRFGLLAIPLWGMLFQLRPELGLVLLLGFVAAVLFRMLLMMDRDISVSSLTAVLGGVGILGFGFFAELLYSLQSANISLASRADGGAVYLDGMQYSSWFDFFLAAPGRGLYFQFAPFPLHVESLFHLLGFSMTPLLIVLSVSAIRSLYRCDSDETVAFTLGVVYLAGIVGYGMINSNFGTNVRHRIVFDFLLVIFALPVIHRWELLVREWLGIVPRQRRKTDEKQGETEEFHRGIHLREQYTNDTSQ